MKWRDTLLLTRCRLQRKPSVLFSRKVEWNRVIEQTLSHYVPFCSEFYKVNLRRFDILLPLKISDAVHFNKHHRQLHGKKAIVPRTDVIELCNDKLTLCERLSQLGFDRYLPVSGDHLDYPFVLKQRVSAFGKGTYIVDGPVREREARTLLNGEPAFKQELVQGDQEYATHVIMAKGRAVFSGTCRYHFPTDAYVKGQYCRPMKRDVLSCSPHIELFEKMLRAIDYEGFCCIDYKMDGEKPRLLEINPRFGETMLLFINEALPVYQAAILNYEKAELCAV
ncbi:ATP-grasp domain-containing protein [Neorhodopirellula lusitana]|uniref:ATP-grasp domain-containing protein n=1 Tax=Neorhodopirellula lusitana TaxID=445327 RepID=UPI00384FC089